jgi:hypothetical protein
VTFAVNFIGAIINTILSFPFLGPWVRALIRLLVEFWSQVVGLIDAAGRLVGIRIPKFLRICIIILREENDQPVVEPSDLDAAITFARRTFYEGAGVHVRVQGIYTVGQPSPRDNLDVNTEEGAVWDELWLPGGYFQASANYHCFENAFNLAIGLASPVVVFVTRSVRGGTTGCSLLTLTDYVTVERGTLVGGDADPTVLAHELGHACTLVHTPNQSTLMFGTSSNDPGKLRGSYIPPYQVTMLRSSRHVTFV